MTMHAAVLHSFGDTPRFEPFTEPAAGPGEYLVEVLAAALHRIDRATASGAHYASAAALPVVCGTDGVGVTQTGDRVWFALPRTPFGAMAERTVVDRRMQAPIPEALSDAEAAALVNPGMAAFLPLQWRARLQPGETVLVLGATGVAGRLAVQVARLLGAGRVVAAGRDPHRLEQLAGLGADTLIRLGDDPEAMCRAFAAAAGDGYDVVVDYLWGAPTEALLASMLRPDFGEPARETRIVQVGDLAGPQLRLPAQLLRNRAVTVTGSGGFAPPEVRGQAYQALIRAAAAGQLRIGVEEVPLSEVEEVWRRGDRDGRRVVLRP